MNPAVSSTVADNTLGIRAPSNVVLAIIATSTAGTAATPQLVANVPDLQTGFGGGVLVELAAYAIERYGIQCLCCRAASTVAGSYGTITLAGTGTSVPSGDGTIKPDNDYDIWIKFLTGGTIGVTGITYQLSLDGGTTLVNGGAVFALGTATNIVFPDGSVKIILGAGTIVALDVVSCRGIAPKWDTTALDAALTALAATQSK